MTKVVNLYKESYDVYIGRSGKGKESIWRNPFIVGKHGKQEECVDLYEEYIRERLSGDKELIKELMKLKGKTLGCFCKPKRCHGDVLVKLIEEYSNEFN